MKAPRERTMAHSVLFPGNALKMSPSYYRIVLDLQGVTLCKLTPIISLYPENRQSSGYCSAWGCAKIAEGDKKMLVCSCCLYSGHILDKVWVSEKIKVPSHTGFRSVAVQLGCTGRAAELFTITLELNSGPGLVMSTRSLSVNGSAGRSQVTFL